MMDPVIINIDPQKTPFRFPKLPNIPERVSKAITVAAAIIIIISMVIFVIASAVVNSDSFKNPQGAGSAAADSAAGADQNVPPPSNGTILSQAAQPGGDTAVGKGATANDSSPVVSIAATPSSVTVGNASRLQWSATNNPASCTASGDWSGSKASSGAENTPALTQTKTYVFTLTCKNASGSGFGTVSVGAITQGGTGSVGRPAVKLAADPTSVYRGDKSTLIWSTANNPTSCTASGDWSGSKAASGSENTATLATAKQYSYTLTCTNNAGSGFATATVAATVPPANLPVITISSSAVGAVKPGATGSVTWTVENNPASCTASGDWSGSKAARGTQDVGPFTVIKTYQYKLTCGNSAGTVFDSATVQVIPNPPVVTMTASPSSVTQGGTSTLAWQGTNSPTSCTASGDWSGSKAASGSQSTGALNSAKTYLYSISCTNAGGTGYANNIAVKVSPPNPPTVNLSISPISTTVGGSATLSWSSTGNPTSCTASGDWSGSKAGNGSQSTGSLGTAKTYNYNLSCSNAGGSGSSSVSISVANNQPSVQKPVVTIAVNPTTIGTGSASTISWSATNSPSSCTASGGWSGSKGASGSTSTGTITTPGSRTYTMTCSNSAGSGSASATLNVLATPTISISVSPSSINTGGSATLSWTVGNNPTSCTAGGGWSGSKGASGSQPVTPSAAGNYTYSLSCTNSGGTSSNSTTLSVTTQANVYCSGQTPCYGRTDLAQHNTASNCWGYNLDWVIDITSYAPHHKGGTGSGNMAAPGSTCNADIHPILAGTSAIPGYTDRGGAQKHNHNNATENNLSTSQLRSYLKGYYDPNKP